MTDWGFRSSFENMIVTTSRYLGTRPLVVPLDGRTAEHFASLGFDVLPRPRPFGGRRETFGSSRRDVLAYDATLFLLQRGLRVVYFDMDIFMRGSPLTYADPEVDFWALGQSFDPVVNNGFFMAEPTPRAEQLFSMLVHWITTVVTEQQRRDCVDLDSFALDFALRGLEDLEGSPWSNHAGCRSVTAAQLRVLRSGGPVGSGLRWAYLPIREFAHYAPPPAVLVHGQEFFPFVARGSIHLDPSDARLRLLHLWGTAGSPDARAVLSCLMGFWHWGGPPAVPAGPLRGCAWCRDGWPEVLAAQLSREQYRWCWGASIRNDTAS